MRFLNDGEDDEHFFREMQAMLYREVEDRISDIDQNLGIIQMTNAGGNYYAGAVLQLLMSIKSIAKFLVSQHSETQEKPWCESLKNVFIDNYQRRPEGLQEIHKTIDIYQLMTTFSEADSDLKQDPCKFLKLLVDRIAYELEGCQSEKFEGLREMFRSVVEVATKCKECAEQKVMTEEQIMVRLPIPGSVRVRLERMVGPNELDRMPCKKCGKQTFHYESKKFSHLPEFLIFTQTMFSHNFRLGTLMPYFEQLDMQPFSQGSGNQIYNLLGVISCDPLSSSLSNSNFTVFT